VRGAFSEKGMTKKIGDPHETVIPYPKKGETRGQSNAEMYKPSPKGEGQTGLALVWKHGGEMPPL